LRAFREAMAFAGRIADIDLMDPNFYRSIFLMIEHNEEGASGLVVNRPSQYSLGEMIEGVDDTPAASIPVCVEGPVQQNALFVLHEGFGDAAAAEPATSPLIDYLKGHWGELPAEDRPSVRIYAGYSGCGSGQLEGELKVDS